MKRIGNLYEKIIGIDNLYKAERRARRGKSKRSDVSKYVENLDSNILELHLQLLSETYKTGEYYYFTIFEPKKRCISRLPYRDRIIHHAILLIIEPILLRSFISQTYNCIKRRGIIKQYRYIIKCLKDVENTKFCLKIDIKRFYPSINRDILKTKLRRKFKDKRLLNLLDNIIDSHSGLPLGLYTSQWMANFYLSQFDHWIKEDCKIKYYARYCDDIIILAGNKEYLHKIKKDIIYYLSDNLDLQLSKYQVFPVNIRGIDVLGYVFYHNYIKLRKSIKLKWIRMLKTNKNKHSVASYNGWLSYCNSVNLQRKYLNNDTLERG